MGTSASSKGPGGGVPLIPPWVPPVDPLPDGENSPGTNGDGNDNPQQQNTPSQPVSTIKAPPRRFAATRINLGRFAQNGSRDNLATGLGHYSRSGLGGARRAAQRMGGTAKTAGALYGVLDALRTRQTPPVDLGVDPAALTGRPAGEVADRIINAIRPIDGTQDAEASRDAVALAISDLINQLPSIDLTALTIEQIDFVTERYVAYDICHRLELDVGKAIFDKAPDVASGMRRLEEIRQYIQEKVSACFRSRAEQGQRLTRNQASGIADAVIRDTFTVFEEYLK